jgi:biopolymer transport protein ExbD
MRPRSRNSHGAEVVSNEGWLTAYSDLITNLLIFFMISSSFAKDMKIDIKRPGAGSSETASAEAIKIFVDKNQEVTVDGQPVRLWVLQSTLRNKLKAGKSQNMLVVADGRVPATKLVEVVDQCYLAGAKDVGVATEKTST